ncbi:MAG: glycosyltransferase family 4 protein [Planctomycetales bacterium]|nr:glycosyltransferase family 4 protein [Planctomycetales bacterium]
MTTVSTVPAPVAGDVPLCALKGPAQVAPLNVGITSFGADGGKSGISQYVIQLLRQFSASNSAEFQLYVYDTETSLFPATGQVSAIPLPARLRHPVANLAWHQLALPRWCQRQRHDVLFLPAGNRRLTWKAPCPTVGTVHDLSALHVRGKYDWARSGYIRHVLPRLIRRLTRVLTISQSSKQDIVEYAKVPADRVTVAPLAVDHAEFFPRDTDECRDAVEQWLGVKGPFLLYISRLEHPGKNHVRLIEAFNELKRKHGLPHRLLLPGSDWCRADRIHRAAALSPWSHDIVLPGFVPSELLPLLYNAADVHVFPSLYEGFGLPLLEAMATGVPTACSNTSSLPEVAGDAAELFDPLEVDDIVAAIERLIFDGPRRQQLIVRGLSRAKTFSWERTARQTLSVLEEAAGC